jgi:hypothetical protein
VIDRTVNSIAADEIMKYEMNRPKKFQFNKPDKMEEAMEMEERKKKKRKYF